MSERERLAVLLLLVAALAFLVWSRSSEMRRWRNRVAACEHVPVVEDCLGQDPAFARVEVGTCSAGALLLVGQVESSAVESRLRVAVSKTAPPVRVLFSVLIDE